MRKLTALILVICISLGSALVVSAADPVYTDMVWFEDVYYVDGTRHQLGADSAGTGYYFVDGVLQKGKGVVFVNGSYYYVRTAGQLATGRYWATYTTVDLVPAANYYNFGSDFRMIDPPAYPENWSEEWSTEWPFPTEPPETEPPTDPPASDPDEDPVPFSPVWGFDLLNQALVFGTDVWTSLMENTGLWPYFSAVVFLLLLGRFLLRPVFGSGISLGAGRSDRASDRRKDD